MGPTWIDALCSMGVLDVFLAPGSRSTPLALSASAHPAVRLHRHFDERALGFYALGCALAREAPVAIVVTSGTAVGNLLPAIMEAHHASVPLLVFSADRPAELQDCSANQTTMQHAIFGHFVRGAFELDLTLSPNVVRSKIAHAVLLATAPHPGPVHINCPLREPLYPMALQSGPCAQIHLSVAASAPPQPVHMPPRGVLLVGRLPKRADIRAALELGKRLQWPVFADILSSARMTQTPEQIAHFDWLLHEAPRPEAVVHLGERLTSKRLALWLTKFAPERYLHVSPHGHWNDPSALLTERIMADIGPACESITGAPDPLWLAQWQALERAAAGRLERAADSVLTESAMMRALCHRLEGAVFLGNSMPIREADWFLRSERVGPFFCNRGLSGIDGNIATAVGLAEGLEAPLTAILGDLTALHDLASLALLKDLRFPVRLIISNNGGGGIFSHLSVANHPRFEELFAFQHTLEFEHAARMFSLPYSKVTDVASLNNALQETESCVIEVITSRKNNFAFHEALKCSTALS